jgi:rare lipoprotein A
MNSASKLRPYAAIAVAVCGVALAGCAETELIADTAKRVQPPSEPAPSAAVGRYKVGDAYQINGQWYYPAENYRYTETGIASWYGPGFHARLTANGETYDQNALTAAHRTLPLPSAVRVTNLENGRSLVLRVNDRGPFARGRVIDVSRRGAQLLGFADKGTAKVRVEVLADESRKLKLAALNGPMSADEQVQIAAAPREAVTASALPAPDGGPAPVVDVPVAEPLTARRIATPEPELPKGVDVLPISPTGIYVQAGAFGRLENALRMRDRLYSVGPTQISRFPVGGTEVYRVRIGPLDSVNTADATLARLVAAGVGDARLVVE